MRKKREKTNYESHEVRLQFQALSNANYVDHFHLIAALKASMGNYRRHCGNAAENHKKREGGRETEIDRGGASDELSQSNYTAKWNSFCGCGSHI